MPLLQTSPLARCPYPSSGWFLRTFLFACGVAWFEFWIALLAGILHHILFMHEFEAKEMPRMLFGSLTYSAVAALGFALALKYRAVKGAQHVEIT